MGRAIERATRSVSAIARLSRRVPLQNATGRTHLAPHPASQTPLAASLPARTARSVDICPNTSRTWLSTSFQLWNVFSGRKVPINYYGTYLLVQKYPVPVLGLGWVTYYTVGTCLLSKSTLWRFGATNGGCIISDLKLVFCWKSLLCQLKNELRLLKTWI